MRTIACILALCAALMGCGQKGPLFLPDDESGQAQAQAKAKAKSSSAETTPAESEAKTQKP